MPNVAGEKLFAMVSAVVSAGDGVQYDTMAPQPPALPPLPPMGQTGVGSVSNPMFDMLEWLRRSVTHITTPSTTIISGTGASSVAIAFGTATPSGIAGMFQGWPFVISGLGTLSGSPTSACSTTSSQIRKVLVTLGMSALPPGSATGQGSSLALGGGTVQFVYGSAVATSAGAVTSGGQTISYFDYVPLPRASAGEIPLGWINVVNSTLLSVAGIVNSCMITDYRATQGLNMSAMLLGMQQP